MSLHGHVQDVHQSLIVTVAPTTEPVTLDEARKWIRTDDVTNDAEINVAIAAARNTIEQWLRRQLLTATYELSLDFFPNRYRSSHHHSATDTYRDDVLRLEMGPVQSVTSIVYQDEEDVQQTFALSKVSQDLKSDPARLRPKHGEVWPATRQDLNVVVVTYNTGYGKVADVPGGVLVALRMLTLDLYANPGAQAEMKLKENVSYERLLWPHRALRVG